MFNFRFWGSVSRRFFKFQSLLSTGIAVNKDTTSKETMVESRRMAVPGLENSGGGGKSGEQRREKHLGVSGHVPWGNFEFENL